MMEFVRAAKPRWTAYGAGLGATHRPLKPKPMPWEKPNEPPKEFPWTT